MKATLFSLILFVLCAAIVHGQSIPSTPALTISSMHAIAEPRSIALGESMAASAGTASAWNLNPATLAGVRETGADYNQRNFYFPYIDHEDNSAGVWMGTGIGTFALHYNLYDQGEWQITFENGVTGGMFRMLDYTVAASYATDLLSPISAGVTAKLFTASVERVSEDPTVNNARGVYIDLGLLYTVSGILLSSGRPDSLHAGIAVRNIGGDLLMPEIPVETIPVARQWQQIGHLVDAGIEYDLGMLPQDDRPCIRGRLSAGLQMLLNDGSGMPGSSSGVRTSGSAGVEVQLYDIVALRLGTAIQSVDNVYGEAGRPMPRYGFGVNLPLSRLGLEVPLTIGGDYARVTMRQTLDPFSGYPGNDLEAFGLHVVYTAPIIR